MSASAHDCRLRRLVPDDVPAVAALANAAGWNQTEDDIRLLLELAPRGCFGIECDGRVVATTTLLARDDRLAWLGMVLTAASHRRRGFARRLVQRALDEAAASNLTTVKLDATDAGRPLYLSLGFQDEEIVERWAGRLRQVGPAAGRLPSDDRLLRALADRSDVFADRDAFALVRPGARARYLGPFVADTSSAARTLMLNYFAAGEGDLFYWDVTPANTEAVSILRDLGFERVRSLMRMSYGREYPDPMHDRTYAISGFEFG